MGRYVRMALLVTVAATSFAAEQYEVGGPLAGLRLPLYKCQHGEQPGYPGCIPELIEKGKTIDDVGVSYREYGPQGLAPELELYPDAVEHWRAYWFKYCHLRSFFDRQSLLKNFVAAELAGVSKHLVAEYAEPVYWVPRHAPVVNTGYKNKPVPVVRCTARSPVFSLDLGELPIGLYAVRVIGAVKTQDLRPFLRPLYIRLKVNDGPDGATSEYRVRSPYNDQFYSVAEIYFHAPQKRRYRAELHVDEGSQVELLVHNITLDDALAGAQDERMKLRRMVSSGEGVHGSNSENYIGKRAPLTSERRLARDAALWHAFPPLNKHTNDNWAFHDRKIAQGADGKGLAQIQAEHGKWGHVNIGQGGTGRESHIRVFPKQVEHLTTLMVNKRLGLSYSVDDLRANRPLPDPYPHKDDGAGLYYPDPADPQKGQAFCPIAWATMRRLRSYVDYLATGGRFLLRDEPNQDYARDSAVALIRFAYAFPTIDLYRAIAFVTVDPAARGRFILRRRMTNAGVWGNFIRFLRPIRDYDALFDYIKGNEKLAASISRFVPWVKSSDDLLRLLDVYLVQTMAKRMMRYHYYGDGRQPSRMAELAALVGNAKATEPWMQWLFSRTFFYPSQPTGLPDLMISGTDRDGMSPIGSYAYMIGEASGARIAEKLEVYLNAGGSRRFDLRDPKRYPKTMVSLDFDLRSRTAGLYYQRIGDVGGPDKGYACWFGQIGGRMQRGWRWTNDPRFAWVIRHFGKRDGYSESQWALINEFAAKVKRAPWLENRSRVLPGWGAFLESGIEHDDFRFRRSAIVRIGTGYGHGHFDTFDLQVHAHGVPMTVDAGQRGGYSSPGDRGSRVHNTVEVNGQSWLGHSWAQALTDVEGCQYARVQATPLHGTRLYRRQFALIDVDEGRGSQKPLSPQQCGPSPEGLPTAGIVTPNSYIFDVFRIAGGSVHTYCFHATVNDPNGPQPKTNATDVRSVTKPGDEPRVQQAARYVGGFTNEKYCGAAPERLEAVFQLQKTRTTPGKIKEAGTESYLMPRSAYDPQSPNKFTKLHLLNAEGALVMKGDQHCYKWEYWLPHLFVQRSGEDLESAFAAVIEPYAGESFIESVQRLSIPENEDDAQRAVALRVVIKPEQRASRAARTDICFADGRSGKTRNVLPMPKGWRGLQVPLKIAAEFAYYSKDSSGLVRAALAGGTRLETPELKIEAAAGERTGKVVKVDYLEKRVWIDEKWPAQRGRRILEIGALPGSGRGGYITGYTAVAATPSPEGTEITMFRGADYYRSRIKSVSAKDGKVTCVLGAPYSAGVMAGRDRNLVASNDTMTKFWRAHVLPGDRAQGDYPFRLKGGPVSAQDFEPEGALRLWEYGVGDLVRQSTYVGVQRTRPGVFALRSDVDVRLSLRATGIEVSADGQNWEKAEGKTEGRWLTIEVSAAQTLAGPVVHFRPVR